MKIINEDITPVSNVCRPKCNVNKQNEEIERWMRANPKRVKRLKDGENFAQFKKLSTVS